MPQSVQQIVAAIVAAAATFEDASNEITRTLPEEQRTEAMRELSVSWGTRVEEVPAPTVLNGNATTFAMPHNITPYVERVINEGTPYASYTQPDAAEVFTRWHASHILRCRQSGQWYAWDGKRWVVGANGLVDDAVSHFLAVYGQAALRDIGGKPGAAAQKSICTAAFHHGTYSLLQNKQEISVGVDALDQGDWTLNTPSGLLDLRSNTLTPHSPDALCTKITSVAPISDEEYEAAFPASRFARFLEEIFGEESPEERRELIAFEQASLGYCLTGDSKLHFLKFWYGEGRNGKSTLGEVVAHVMGDYAKKVSNQILTLSKYDRHPTDVANLMGVRLAIASEVSEGSFLNETLVKELTGDSRLSARFMRQDYFEFRRTHKHLIYGNSKPRLRLTDAAIRARMKLTPFKINFEREGRLDPELNDKLREESGLILSWLARGAALLAQNGMALPRSKVVEEGTQEYMDENDLISQWVAENCVITPNAKTRNTALYENYAEWRRARGEMPETYRRWAPLIRSRPEVKDSILDGYPVLLGIGLRL